MNRPWKIWLVFGACAAVVLAALGWLSLTALNLERAQLQAGEKAETEERVRLALWRMDSALAPLIVEESARPWSAYEAFSGSELAYTKGGAGYSRAQQGDVLVPSPLLAFNSSNVLLHFQFGANGQLSSPQVPVGQQSKLAGAYATPEHVAAATARLAELGRILHERAPPEFQVAAVTGSAGKGAAAPVSLDNGTVLLQ